MVPLNSFNKLNHYGLTSCTKAADTSIKQDWSQNLVLEKLLLIYFQPNISLAIFFRKKPNSVHFSAYLVEKFPCSLLDEALQ